MSLLALKLFLTVCMLIRGPEIGDMLMDVNIEPFWDAIPLFRFFSLVIDMFKVRAFIYIRINHIPVSKYSYFTGMHYSGCLVDLSKI